MKETEFYLNGKHYRFVYDPATDDPNEGAMLTYVGNETGRLRPSEDAEPEAWEIANKNLGLK